MNRGEIKTAIQALGYATDTDTAQNTFINDLNRRLHSRKRWPWQEATATGALAVSGTTVTSVPADLLLLDAVRVTAGTQNIELEHMDAQELRRLLHLDRTNGYPQYWTYFAGSLLIYPRANAAYTVPIDYVKKHTDLTSDGDVPAPPTTYHDIYTYYGAMCLAARERDWTAYGAYAQQYRDRVAEMEAELGIEQRQTASQVERPTWYGNF